KPQNIHIGTDGTVKLIDFGIAKSDDFSLTQPGKAPGTPYYMAPEQVTGGEPTHLVDVYAFGLVLYELLTETRPTLRDLDQIYYRILNEPLDLQPLREAGVPASISVLVQKCTAKIPSERIQSFREIREQLDTAGDDLPLPKPRAIWSL